MMLTGQHTDMGKESISPQLPQQLGILQLLTNLTNQRLIHLPDLLEVIVREVRNTVDSAQFCLIALYNPQTQQLELSSTVGIGADKLPFLKLNGSLKTKNSLWGWREKSISCNRPFHNSSSLLTQVFTTGVSQLFQGNREKVDCVVEDLPSCPLFSCTTAYSAFTPASMYAVAIKSAQAGQLGVLAIGNWENPHAFNAASQHLLDALGEVAAIAINNTIMLQVLQEREERLAKQNEILLAQNRELEQIRQQMQLQNQQLVEAAELKSQFLATTSHELRTPLNVILGLSQVLLRQRTTQLSEPQIEMVQRILNNGNHLLSIIEDMLDFANVEAGNVSFHPEEFNLTDLLLTTVAEHRFLAEEKLLDLQVEINLACDLIVNDSDRLRQVLVKLLLNAIKFTARGRVTVKAWDISSDRIAIAVQDTGIGIAPHHLECIFEQFRQVDQSNSRQYEGMGLGLAITKSLVQMMQGTISVFSKLGEGSTFQIELPKIIRN
ncbi:HAMP domain-containing histidine kinase [Tolypothrix sp. FACHB-123]|uniref:GAF domain-containing sensor histidine kinase n=1 Tax=Tolypothrix sp. FACHB-123 TaxID=2692868 RepID=UPI0016840F86|nr:GAF domain-containing sensor histidine kinase [Tolypothrix sp. FACHB-123]MBD2354631.1 HAMP domain-containing histidine kinase [Tolypothrix sp. FACHB-123]